MARPPEIVVDLVERFERNFEAYHAQGYNETQVRQEFINPFFEALGWDVANRAGHAEAYKDLIHEEAIKVGAPDYCFRIGGTRKFFLEAKRPAVGIKDNPDPAYQLRRYAWSANLPLSVVTNFAEFAAYECLTRPRVNDQAGIGRTLYITYKEYLPRWDEIASIFSKDAVLKGSFDKYVATDRKRGTARVDAAFLAEIETWRLTLARNLATRNPGLDAGDLNFAVQRTIDRIIFLRICEDRDIEPYAQLQALLNGENVYARLRHLYGQADERYNSGLFHFRREKERAELPDELTLQLNIDDKALKDIIRALYLPESPYEFSVMPAEILGQVYEQFLGKVIRLTAGHAARVDEKPEVKKAGGVYYTPAYIVDYIVLNTVGKLCEGKTPTQISKLKILDPACGSGSFLIGAYEYLVTYHRDWYLREGAQKYSKQLYQGAGGLWHLTTQEKKRILLNSIFGVDVDSQAVEVTKLSLLLKVLDGENNETLMQQLKMFHERALPDLGRNIKWGNSLIGYDGHQLSIFQEQDEQKAQVFNWKQEFSDIMERGGFDAVIGNPPWLMAGYYVNDDTLDYLREHFETAQGKFDMYYCFIERGLQLLSDKGLFGMIVPNKMFHTNAAAKLRQKLRQSKWIRGIVDFGDEKIFQGATNYSCILFLQKRAGSAPQYAKARTGLRLTEEFEVPWSALNTETWHFERQETRNLFEKMEKVGVPLEQLTSRFGTGVQSGADRLLMFTPSEAKQQSLEAPLLRPVYRGRDVRRYSLATDPKLLVFPYKVVKNEFQICSEAELRKSKNVYRLLHGNKAALAKRIWFDKNAEELSGKWYGMMYLDSYESFASRHILTPALSNQSNFTIGSGNLFATGTAGVTSIIPKPDIEENILYLLGVLNSALISYYAVSHSPVFSGAYYKFSSPYLKKLPTRRINFSTRSEKTKHDRIVVVAALLLDLYKRMSSAKTPAAKTALLRQIEVSEAEINRLVYELYELTDTEVNIVEGHVRVSADSVVPENVPDEEDAAA